MMKRVTWFAGGVAAGLAGAGYAKKKVKEVASNAAPAQVAKTAVAKARAKTQDVADAVREGRAVMNQHEDELRCRAGKKTLFSRRLGTPSGQASSTRA